MIYHKDQLSLADGGDHNRQGEAYDDSRRV
jgi:hypothetical protein